LIAQSSDVEFLQTELLQENLVIDADVCVIYNSLGPLLVDVSVSLPSGNKYLRTQTCLVNKIFAFLIAAHVK
jgi:hypothetical protein